MLVGVPPPFVCIIKSIMQTVAPNVLRSLPLFAELGEQEKSILIQGGKMRRYESGQNIFLYGDPIHNFYVVCDGAVQLFRETPDGHEMTAEVLIAGDAIGETEILQLSPTHKFNALAIKDSTLLEFPVSWLKDNVKRNGTLALNVLGMLSRRAHIATVEAEHKATMTAAQQVACFLERMCILHDFDPHGFDLPYSKTLIASRLGMELETFSRALSKIRNHGISIQGNRVAFSDIQEMEDFVCSNCSISGNCGEHEQLRQRLLRRKPAHAT
jgi:CRP/FNR family transcriptional regulator, dissimilatory nitrate respiration regulator